MLELMHEEQTNSSIVSKIEHHNSQFADLFTKKVKFWEVGD
jgi:hypothetical protein